MRILLIESEVSTTRLVGAVNEMKLMELQPGGCI